jgi:hypothetical protein
MTGQPPLRDWAKDSASDPAINRWAITGNPCGITIRSKIEIYQNYEAFLQKPITIISARGLF